MNKSTDKATSAKTVFLRWFIPVLLIYIAGFAVATIWDMRINQAIYTPQSGLGIFLEVVGWWPAFMPAVMLAMLYLTQPRGLRQAPWHPIVAAIVLLAGLAAIYYMSFGYLQKRGLVSGLADVRAFIWLMVGLALAAITFVLVHACTGTRRQRLIFFAWCGSIFMLANQIVVYALKLVWQRTRFDDMLAAGDFSPFTSWFQPFGAGGSSFPSGHTANACGIFVLIILCDLFPAWARRRKLVYALCWAYIAIMAWSRILIGRHFLSDTLAASALMAMLFYVLRSSNLYRRGVRRLQEKEEKHAV